MNKIIFFLFLLSLTSCFKTAEDIRREKQIDQSAKMIADLTNEVTTLRGHVASTSGQIQEIDHKQSLSLLEQQESFRKSLMQLQEQVQVLTKENQENKAIIQKLQNDVNRQKAFIKKVTKALSLQTDTGASLLKQAHKAFEKNQQKEAKNLYLQVMEENKINAAQKNGVRYNLGLLYYWNKEYDQALVYFSQIYTKWPKSSYAPRALLYIARCFDKTNKKDEASATYKELVNKYPNSAQAKEAKKEM